MHRLLTAGCILVLGPTAFLAQGARTTLISPSLGPGFEAQRQGLAAAGKESRSTTTAEVRVIADQHSEALVRGFTVVQDEPPTAFGTGKGPTPTDYFTASIGFCENVIFVRNAAMAKLSIDSLETRVAGSWDRRGLFEIDGASPAFKTITVETRVSTREPVEKVVEVTRQTHRRCPIEATLATGATSLLYKLVVNGRETPLP